MANIMDFNSRPCGRGDGCILCASDYLAKFQFTPLREGRRRGPPEYGHPSPISIHAPAGGATESDTTFGGGTLFQFTPLREGRQAGQETQSTEEEFQFTPLREGRLANPYYMQWEITISIHAPAGGATLEELLNGTKSDISIHAPAGGATRTQRPDLLLVEFQFTPLREGRLHKPKVLQTNYYGQFQFTPLREGRRLSAIQSVQLQYFNSRPCGRGDYSCDE